MKCNGIKPCKFYDCYVNSSKQVIQYCKLRGIEIKELDENTQDNCNRYKDSFYTRHDILKSEY
jgi:hypothetical protein